MFKSAKNKPQIVNSDSSELDNLKQELLAYKLKTAQLEGIQSAMPDPYYVLDMNNNIVIWPPAIAKLTGFSEQEAKTMKCYQMFKSAVCPPKSECPTIRCVHNRQFLRDVAVNVYHKDGNIIHCLVSNAGIYDEDGNPIGAVEIVKDNTVIQNTMNSIGGIIEKIDAVAGNLSTAMEQVNSASKKLSEKSSETLTEIKTGVQTGIAVGQKAGESSKYISNVQHNMNDINNSMKFSVDKISSLKDRSEMIMEFIKMIQEISSKTNLLSINASIEAAHAGEAGKGFKVVADGIRELSKNSNESANSINNTVKEINGLIKEVTASFNTTEQNIEFGTNTISELLVYVNEISDSVKDLMTMISGIERVTNSTSEHISEQNALFTEVRRIGAELSNIAKMLTQEFDVVFKAIQKWYLSQIQYFFQLH